MTLARTVTCSVVMVGLAWGAALGVSTDPLQQFKIASNATQNGRDDAAIQEYEAFLRHHGTHRLVPQARLAIGEILFRNKKYAEAAEVFSEVVKRHGSTYEGQNARLRLGQCAFNMGEHLKATDHFEAVRRRGSAVLRAEALLSLANAWLALRDRDKAVDLFSDLLQSYPTYRNNPAAVIPLGLIYLERNRLQDALDTMDFLPDHLGARFYRGVALMKLGRTIAASQSFKDVFDADMTGFWADKAQLQMAEAYYRVDELNLAYDSYRRVFDNFPLSGLRSYALHRMACILFQMGRFQEAGLKWEELLRTFQDDVNLPYGVYMLGEMALREKEYPKAIAFFSQITDDHDLRMDAQYKILWCLAEQRKDETAVTKAEQFIRDYPWGELTAKAHLIRGLCLQRMKRFREANNEYQIVLDRFKDSVFFEKALYLMSTSLFQNNQLAEIVTSLNANLKAAAVSPSRWQAETYLWIAEAYFALRQFDAAHRTYQLIFDNYKGTPKLAYAMLGVAASLAEAGRYDEAGFAHERALALAEEHKTEGVQRSVLMDTAQVLYTQKRYERAMGYFDEFVTRYPDDPLVPQALYQGGMCFYRLEYYTEAMNRWRRLWTNHPGHSLAPEALMQIGKTHFGLGDYTDAAATFQLFVETFPAHEQAKDARIQIAQSHYNQGHFDVAAERLQEFLNNHPRDPKAKDVQELLQMAHYRQGQSQADLARLTEKFPRSRLTADIYWQTGAEAFNRKEYKQALDHFTKLVGEFPEAQQIAQAYYYMAESHFHLGDHRKAAAAYKNFTLNFPDDPNHLQALFRLGISHFQSDNFREAVVAFNDVLETDPKGGLARDAMMNIALSLRRMNQPVQAISANERILNEFPNDPDRNRISLQIAQLHEDADNFDVALEHYRRIADTAPEAFDGLLAQGRLLRVLKRPSEELAAYEALRQKTPHNNAIRLTGLVTLAELYQDQGRIPQAIAVYEDIARNTDNPDWRQAAQDRARMLRTENQ